MDFLNWCRTIGENAGTAAYYAVSKDKLENKTKEQMKIIFMKEMIKNFNQWIEEA